MVDLPPTAPARPRAGAAVRALFLVAALAATAAAVLAGVATAGTGAEPASPEACCPEGGPPPAPATPAATPPSPAPGPTREPPLPLCIVGSWRVTTETFRIEFYTDVGPIPFSSSGREYEFRPDGTGTIFYDDVAATGSYQGDALRVEYGGRVEFAWSADRTTITYDGRSSTVSWRTYVNSRRTNSGRDQTGADFHEVDQYRCRGGVLEEGNPDTGYQAVWERTGGFGWYG